MYLDFDSCLGNQKGKIGTSGWEAYNNSELNVSVPTQGAKCTESQHENRVLYTCGLTHHMKNVHGFFRYHGST